MKEYEDLLNSAFAYKPKNGAKAPTPKPFVPEMAKAVQAQEDMQSLIPPPIEEPIVEEPIDPTLVSPDNMAFVQAAVWGQGQVPPPKSPTNKMLERGSAEAMKGKEGWGQV